MSVTIIFCWVFNHTRASLLIAILMHATIDAFTSTAVGTGLFSEQWILKHENLTILLGFGAVALVLVMVTCARLRYQRPASPLDAVSAFNDGKSWPAARVRERFFLPIVPFGHNGKEKSLSD